MTRAGVVWSIIGALVVTFFVVNIAVTTQDSDTPEQAKQIQELKQRCVEIGGDYKENAKLWIGASRATQSVTCTVDWQVTK